MDTNKGIFVYESGWEQIRMAQSVLVLVLRKLCVWYILEIMYLFLIGNIYIIYLHLNIHNLWRSIWKYMYHLKTTDVADGKGDGEVRYSKVPFLCTLRYSSIDRDFRTRSKDSLLHMQSAEGRMQGLAYMDLQLAHF